MEHIKWCKVCNKLYSKDNKNGEKEFEKLMSDADECCGEPLIELDKPIAEAIQIMNAKGYETIYSCAGHVEHVEGSLPERICITSLYVVFCPTKNHEKALAFLLNNVPLGFKLSYHKPGKYVHPDAYPYTIVLEPNYPVGDDDDRSHMFSYYMKHHAMTDYLARNTLYVWAKEFLPDLNEN